MKDSKTLYKTSLLRINLLGRTARVMTRHLRLNKNTLVMIPSARIAIPQRRPVKVSTEMRRSSKSTTYSCMAASSLTCAIWKQAVESASSLSLREFSAKSSRLTSVRGLSIKTNSLSSLNNLSLTSTSRMCSIRRKVSTRCRSGC